MIHLMNDYYVDVDSNNNYILKIDTHNKDKHGNDIYKSLGFFGSLKNAIIGLKRQLNAKALSEIDCDLTEAVKIINSSNDVIKKLLENIIKE